MSKIEIGFFLVCVILAILIVPVSATDYNVGVIQGHYIKFGNIVGNASYSYYSNLDWVKFEVTAVSGKNVIITMTLIFKNGTAYPGSGNKQVYDIEKYTINGTQQPPDWTFAVIAANLTQGDRISPYTVINVTRTENRIYFGLSRTVNVVNINYTSGSITSMTTLAYDRVSGILLEYQMEQTDSTRTAILSYNVTETDIFTGEPIPEFPSFIVLPSLIGATLIVALILKRMRYNKSA
ncbi:MAG: hypothetical protein MUO85_06465 [candidate division Zixibacteria bacterium]|nr:hypothetical protein [candidate division Zixibacteria bacterium]